MLAPTHNLRRYQLTPTSQLKVLTIKMQRSKAKPAVFNPVTYWCQRVDCKRFCLTIDAHADQASGFLSHEGNARAKTLKSASLQTASRRAFPSV